jgi:hypothetical protein
MDPARKATAWRDKMRHMAVAGQGYLDLTEAKSSLNWLYDMGRHRYDMGLGCMRFGFRAAATLAAIGELAHQVSVR